MWSIIRSCLLTIAACVYRVIHQNIPDPEAGWWKRQGIRAKITLYVLMTPEMMIWWAMRQWFGAKEVADQVNNVKPELKWTLTHGHFAQMGGFGRLDDGRVLHPPTLITLLETGQIDVEELRRVTEERINDHSKGDILSKGIVALQTTWFAFECLARLHQGLPLLELEVVTLAFAVLNTLTYAFWWHKPLDVRCPVYLHILPPQEALITSPPYLGGTGESLPLLDNGVVEVKEKRKQKGVVQRTWNVVAESIAGAGKSLLGVVGSVWKGLCAVGKDIKEDVWGTLWRWLIEEPFLLVAGPLLELFISDDEVDEDATHVATFYGMQLSDGKTGVVWFSCSVIGMAFGAIHFLSWHSAFLTHTQLLLWRISTIALVAEPFCLALEAVLVRIVDGVDDPPLFVTSFLVFFFPVSFFLGPIVYVLARMCLLVLAFLTLRNPPPAALETISWT
ncbi:hypothetical protein BDN72DRAFT_805573, partial [Pluteus cervinus]